MEQKRRLAIFDIDGTIFRRNLHFELINELVWLGSFPSHVRNDLIFLYRRWIEHTGTYEEYRRALIGLYSQYLSGCSTEDVLRAATSVVSFRERQTYIFAERLIAKFREEGFFLLAISGSPAEIVSAYNEGYLHFDKALGSVYEVGSNGQYTGVATFEPSLDKGKVARECLEEYHLDFSGSYGIGDTESDAGFLELVEHPIAFNPNNNLKDIAAREQWRIVVEKKDVVYEADPNCLKTITSIETL